MISVSVGRAVLDVVMYHWMPPRPFCGASAEEPVQWELEAGGSCLEGRRTESAGWHEPEMRWSQHCWQSVDSKGLVDQSPLECECLGSIVWEPCSRSLVSVEGMVVKKGRPDLRFRRK